MDINRLSKGNLIKYKSRQAFIMDQLNYNEYLIDYNGKMIVVNILDISPVELKDSELKNLGFNKGEKKKNKNRNFTVWSKELDIEGEKSIMNIDIYDKLPDLSLSDLSGVENVIPTEYKYVHQVQNIVSYLSNESLEYSK